MSGYKEIICDVLSLITKSGVTGDLLDIYIYIYVCVVLFWQHDKKISTDKSTMVACDAK